MLPKINPTTTPSWQALQQHYSLFDNVQMRDLFFNDADRYSRFSIQFNDLLFDYSKNIITENTLELLLQLAHECGLKESIAAMFSGEKINERENRAVLHTALRNFSGNAVITDGKDVMPDISAVLQQMNSFCEKIHTGEWLGFTGKKIKYIRILGQTVWAKADQRGRPADQSTPDTVLRHPLRMGHSRPQAAAIRNRRSGRQKTGLKSVAG